MSGSSIQAFRPSIAHWTAKVPPDPTWQKHKKTIISFTLRRTLDHVRGSLHNGTSLCVGHGAQEAEEVEQVVLSMLNSDTRRDSITHHETGCCKSEEDAKQKVFAAIQRAELLPG